MTEWEVKMNNNETEKNIIMPAASFPGASAMCWLLQVLP